MEDAVRELQDAIRDHLITRWGIPSESIDGKGSDAGHIEFTLCEVDQAIVWLLNNRSESRCNVCGKGPLMDTSIWLTRFNQLGDTPAQWRCQHCL